MTTIEILKTIRPELKWTPIQGENTTNFIERKLKEFGDSDPNALDDVLKEAQTILGRCVPPSESSGSDTGLVVGYVQSGKTLSFTTVMSLARDNGYKLVILIAGIAVNLKNQSENRLVKDLGLEEPSRSWVHFENPANDDWRDIQNALDTSSNPRVPAHKQRAVLITVLKNHKRLENLVSTLKHLKLNGIPSLIIDDEGDQASLNTKTAANKRTGGNSVSATYKWISKLKSALPHHSVLQYTATPQANLLISIADVLSPSFAELVTPGIGYVGGKEIFKGKPPLVTVIPSGDVPSTTSPIRHPPASLQSAIRYFLLGAAVHTCLKQRGNRSMMVHPSQKTAPHQDYRQWVEDTVSRWKEYFDLPETNQAYQACKDLFLPEYNSLKASFPHLPGFDELMGLMPFVIRESRIVQVNSTQQGLRDVRWSKSDYWILIGGQKLDRGFTVEGLTVTYMPRPIGSGNADTLQQRARFFGYKSAYKGLCRIFLLNDVKEAFEHYVEHEEFIREALEAHRGYPLMEWKRDFILTRALSPTRPSVIGLDISPVQLDEGWSAPRAMYRDSQSVEHNRKLLSELAEKWKAQFGCADAAINPRFKDRRANSPKNLLIENVPLQDVLAHFLLQVRVPDIQDSETLTALTLVLREALEKNPSALCDVFLIAELKTDNQHRSLLSNGRINQVFQGKSPNTDDFEALNYVGDQALHHGSRPTLHLRMFDLKKVPSDMDGEDKAVPWFSVHLPRTYTKDLIIEQEGRVRVKRS